MAARHAFVVGRERDGYAMLSINGEGMGCAANAENQIVTAEIDFHHDVALLHFIEQLIRAPFIHDVDAVADAFGVTEFDGFLSDGIAQIIERHQVRW